MSEWQRITKDQPPKGERCLFAFGQFVGEGYMTVSGRVRRYDGLRDETWLEEPVYWMPIPKAPNIKKEQKT